MKKNDLKQLIREMIQSISESSKPGSGIINSKRIYLDDDELGWFGYDEFGGRVNSGVDPELKNLLKTKKVSLEGNELWYFKDDKETKKVLRKFLEI